MAEQGEDDKTAAELMMFLAHSPSPIKRFESSPVARSTGGTARVLFAEPIELGNPAKVTQHSNLALARPITAGDRSTDMQGGSVSATRET